MSLWPFLVNAVLFNLNESRCVLYLYNVRESRNQIPLDWYSSYNRPYRFLEIGLWHLIRDILILELLTSYHNLSFLRRLTFSLIALNFYRNLCWCPLWPEIVTWYIGLWIACDLIWDEFCIVFILICYSIKVHGSISWIKTKTF